DVRNPWRPTCRAANGICGDAIDAADLRHARRILRDVCGWLTALASPVLEGKRSRPHRVVVAQQSAAGCPTLATSALGSARCAGPAVRPPARGSRAQPVVPSPACVGSL